jgi:hypothetical protein
MLAILDAIAKAGAGFKSLKDCLGRHDNSSRQVKPKWFAAHSRIDFIIRVGAAG